MNQSAVILIYGFLCGFGIGFLYEMFRFVKILFFPQVLKKEIKAPVLLKTYDKSTDICKAFCNEGSNKACRICVCICDALFCVVAAFFVIVFILYTNDGVIRAFIMFGCFLGFFIYLKSVGKIISKTLLFGRNLTFKILKKIYIAVSAPVSACTRKKRVAREMRKDQKKAFRDLNKNIRYIKKGSTKNERDKCQ